MFLEIAGVTLMGEFRNIIFLFNFLIRKSLSVLCRWVNLLVHIMSSLFLSELIMFVFFFLGFFRMKKKIHKPLTSPPPHLFQKYN